MGDEKIKMKSRRTDNLRLYPYSSRLYLVSRGFEDYSVVNPFSLSISDAHFFFYKYMYSLFHFSLISLSQVVGFEPFTDTTFCRVVTVSLLDCFEALYNATA